MGETESALDTLSPDDRRLFARRYWFSCSVNELASYMKCKPHRVTVKLSRIRNRLTLYFLRTRSFAGWYGNFS